MLFTITEVYHITDHQATHGFSWVRVYLYSNNDYTAYMNINDKLTWLKENGRFFNCGYNGNARRHRATWAPYSGSTVFRRRAHSVEELYDTIFDAVSDLAYDSCFMIEEYPLRIKDQQNKGNPFVSRKGDATNLKL